MKIVNQYQIGHDFVERVQFNITLDHPCELSDWCKSNTKGKWGPIDAQMGGIHGFAWFYDKNDAMAFKLAFG